MAGSKAGKHVKRKGKSKSNKSDTVNKKPEVSNSELDLAQTSNRHPDGPRDPEDKNPQPNISSELSTSRSNYTENELEEFLYIKLEALFAKAKDWLLKSGYSMEEVETAILHAGFVHGQNDLLCNVLTNCMAYITKKDVTDEAFKDMDALCRGTLETMVHFMMQTCQGIHRSDAVWHLLISNWCHFPSTTKTSHLRSEQLNSIWVNKLNGSSSLSGNERDRSLDLSSTEKVLFESQIDSSFKKVGAFERTNLTPALRAHLRLKVLIVTAAVLIKNQDPETEQQAIPSASHRPTEVPDILSSDFLRSMAGCSYEASLRVWLESNSDDPKAALIVDLVKSMRELHEKVKEQKEWAQKKVIDSARRLSKDLLELKMLKTEKFGKEKSKNEKIYAEKVCILMLMETEQTLQKVSSEERYLADSMRVLETENAQMRADIEAIKLSASETERNFREVLKRERRFVKKLADVEKQARVLQSQFEDEKQRMMQLEVELLQAEKESDEAENKWKQEIQEKEHMFALLAEEINMGEIRKANSRAQLLKLHQKLEIDSQLARDNLQRLEDELSHLRLSHQMPDMLLEDVNFWFNEASSSASSAPCESSDNKVRHWICMMCLRNEVCIVFLPCTHQVLCSSCYSENFKTIGGQCPYCQAKIEESIKVYAPSA